MTTDQDIESMLRSFSGPQPPEVNTIGDRLKRRRSIYTSAHYKVVPDRDDETYAIINLKTGHCEAKSNVYPQALFAVRSLEKHIEDFFKDEHKSAPVTNIARVLRPV